MIKNLGQVAAIYVGKTAPRNVNMIWLDNTVIPYVFKSYNGEEWTEIPTGAWVETYVNGWLVSLQQGTVTTDDDYLLINSGGVNYKMTVRDFVKSSVGNPLDFKGVIRTDADFPNPSTLESGDMYIIITNPTGGTVTDPYSGKTFSDSEKIVWDSVINSWASLGKIDVKVDLSTTYSATEVTIHSSVGKETTVVGVTDDNAGVMVPVQKKWLDSLSDGSTLTPQGPSTAPYHKHRYSDIVGRIISQQVTGDSAINPMSQKATTEALNLKLDKSSVLQVSGVSTTDVMSQKAVTDAIQTLKSNVDDKLSRYLPLSGGTMTGTIKLATNNVHIEGLGQDGTTTYHILSLDAANRPTFGSSNVGVIIQTKTENILHKKDGGTFIVHDTSNLRDPAKLSADQTFTGTNNFTAGKFNVAGNKSKFSVNDVGGLRMYYDYADDDAGISGYIDFYTKTSSDTDYTRRGVLGLYASKSTPNSDYAYIGAGDVGSEDAQYRFYPNTLYIPETFYLRTITSRRQLIGVDNINNRVQFGEPLIPTWIISNNTDLFHSKYTNQSTHSEYKIWDESNLKYVARITPSNLGYALSFYTTTAGWRDFDDLCINNLMPNASKTIEQGGAGFVGQYESAYASAEIKDIVTQNIFASGGKNLSNVSTGASFLGNESNAFKSAYIGEVNTNTVKSADGKSLLNFKTDGVYMIANSGTEYKLATLNDVSGGGSSASLDGNNTWTGVNIFSGTGLVTNQYDSGNTEIPATANYSIRLACDGSYDNYGFGAVRSEDRVKQSHAFVQTPSAFFTFDNSGSLYTTIGNTKYEFWNKQNLAKPIVYNTNSDGDGVLYKGDSTANRIDSLELVGILPPTNNAVTLSNGGTGGFGNVDNAYAEAYIGNVHANNVTTATIVVPGSENYFEFKEDGLHFYDMVNQEEYKINMTKV